MRTITAMFDSRADAENARARLAGAGISEDNVTIHDKTIMDGADRRDYALADEADGRAGTHRDALGNYVDDRTGKPVGADRGSERNLLGDFVEDGERRHSDDAGDDRSLWDRIKDFFSDDDDVYAEGLRRGGHLLSARVEDHDVERAIAILDVDGIVDLDARQADWRQEGWSGAARRDASRSEPATRVRTYDRSDWPL